MSILKDFLTEQASRQKASAVEVAARRSEWQDSVNGLIGRLCEWLKQADSEDLLVKATNEMAISEEGLGTYKVPWLAITLPTTGRQVRVVPMARNVVGSVRVEDGSRIRAQGRVDLLSDFGLKYVLYRIQAASGEQWYLVDEPNNRAVPLDQESFESAVKSLLE